MRARRAALNHFKSVVFTKKRVLLYTRFIETKLMAVNHEKVNAKLLATETGGRAQAS